MRTRRLFLRSSAVTVFGLGMTPGWLARAAFGAETGRRKILVAIFQRGAVDGLNVVAPFAEKDYYQLRPSIAIPQPGADNGAVDLDGFFALHPSLADLKPIYDAEQLAIVQATGSPDPTRSHFDAQDYMESGTPGRKSTPDGWLNRALNGAEPDDSPVRAVALGKQIPRTLRGPNPAVVVDRIEDFGVQDGGESAMERLYDRTLDTELHGTAEETFEAVRLLKSVQSRAYQPANGARYPAQGLGASLQQVAQLIKADVGVEVAFADVGGWDHHTNETPRLTNLLRQFGGALAAFHRDLGDRMEDVVVVTMSEFGRTARENGNRGTDHGHANVMMAMGGPVKGGKVYGKWPGLANEQLHDGRDLAVTTDFRAVLSEVLAGHMGVTDTAQVFPGFHAGDKLGLL